MYGWNKIGQVIMTNRKDLFGGLFCGGNSFDNNYWKDYNLAITHNLIFYV